MAEMNNNMEQELNEQEKAAAEAAVDKAVPAAPEAPAPASQEEKKPKLFGKGTKSRKVAAVTGISILGTVAVGLGGYLLYKLGESNGMSSVGDVVDGSFVDVTDADTVPFDNTNTDNF